MSRVQNVKSTDSQEFRLSRVQMVNRVQTVKSTDSQEYRLSRVPTVKSTDSQESTGLLVMSDIFDTHNGTHRQLSMENKTNMEKRCSKRKEQHNFVNGT